MLVLAITVKLAVTFAVTASIFCHFCCYCKTRYVTINVPVKLSITFIVTGKMTVNFSDTVKLTVNLADIV